MTPFEMLAQDMDEVIMLINYYIEKGEDKGTTPHKGAEKHEERIKVNDRTATGGWW